MAKRKPQRKPAPRLKEAIVLIPLTYNDGTKVPEAVLACIEQEVFVAFQGWTAEGVVKGAYRMQSGEKRVEELQKYSVVIDEPQVPELEKMVARWGAILEQEAMLLKIADVAVKFVPPEEAADEP